MRINCFAKNKGWLFADIQEWFRAQGMHVSDRPEQADVWLCVRTSEAYSSPNITKTIVQVHDVSMNYDMEFFNQCLGVIFTHPVQSFLWHQKKFCGPSVTLPIGTRSKVPVSNSLSERPTLGFFCGENKLGTKRSLMFRDVVTKSKSVLDFDVLMIGRGLDHIAHLGEMEDRAAGPDDYARIDALISTSISPAVPLSVYEALAAGLPVISTPRWFPGSDWINIYTGNEVDDLAEHVVMVLNHREEFFYKRKMLSRRPYLLEDWIDRCIEYVQERAHD